MKRNKGITLIALIITIVIMLILTTIVIDLFFEGGLFDYAGKAKKEATKVEEKEIIEIIHIKAKEESDTEIEKREKIIEEANKYDSIESVTPIGTSFVIKFKNNNEYILNKSGNISKKEALLAYEIPAQKYGNYVFNYSDIDIADGGESQLADWMVFYAGKVSDEKEEHIYLITSNMIDESIRPLWGATTYNNGSDDVSEETRYLNSEYYKYLDFKSKTSTFSNMKSVAYLCDTNKWSVFKTNKADFAIGAPTLELFVKAYNKRHNTTIKYGYMTEDEEGNTMVAKGNDGLDTIVDNGYKISWNGIDGWGNGFIYKFDINDKTFHNNKQYWIASPGSKLSTQTAFYNIQRN